MRPIKAREPVRVLREVRGDPVEQYAHTALVHVIDEILEVLGRPIPTRGGEVPGDLVPPGAIERMLHHGHQLDVREPHIQHIVRELVGELAVAKRAIALLRDAAP